MKKVISIFFVFLFLLIITGCNGLGSKIIKINNKDDYYKTFGMEDLDRPYHGEYKYKNMEVEEISLESDITLDLNDDYFDYGYNIATGTQDYNDLSNVKLNGNNHTITINGNIDKKIGTYSPTSSFYLFHLLENVEVTNLNIVYTGNLYLKGNGDNVIFAGLARKCKNATITNCSVQFKYTNKIEYYPDQYGFHDNGAGGMCWIVESSKLNSCKVKGNFYVSGSYVGGIAGQINGDSEAKGLYYEGSITTQSLVDSFVGGLAGEITKNCKVSGSKVLISNIDFSTTPLSSRSGTSYCGGLVGSIAGQLDNSYIEFKEGAIFKAKSDLKGIHYVKLNTGFIAARATSSASLFNIYVDCLNDEQANFTQYPDSMLHSSNGVELNEAKKFDNIYFADKIDGYSHSEENIESTPITDEGTSTGDYVNGSCFPYKYVFNGKQMKLYFYWIEPEQWNYVENKYEMILIDDGQEYEKVKHSKKVYDEEQTKVIGVQFIIEDIYRYEIFLDFSQGKARISTKKYLSYFTIADNVTWLEDYENIEFEVSDVIGADDDYWTFDSNGKPILKGIE